MFSETDIERLWFLYKIEGKFKRSSINSFCISNNIPYIAFYDWFKKTQKKIVPVEVEDITEELIKTDNEQQDVTKDKSKFTSPHKGSIMHCRVMVITYMYLENEHMDIEHLSIWLMQWLSSSIPTTKETCRQESSLS